MNNLVDNYIELSTLTFNTFTFSFTSQGKGGCSMDHTHCWNARTCISISHNFLNLLFLDMLLVFLKEKCSLSVVTLVLRSAAPSF